MLQRNALGPGRIFRRIDVEEGVNRLIGPISNSDAMSRGPNLDFVQVLLDQCFAQILAQPQRP
jgi:hypothetical protein